MKKINEIKKDINYTKKTTIKNFAIVLFIITFTVIVLITMNLFLPKPYYTTNDFNIKTIYRAEKSALIVYNERRMIQWKN